MPTIIDSLIVKLGIDSSGFNSGKNKVDQALKETGNQADKAGAKLKKSGSDSASAFNDAAKSAIQFFAIIGGTVAVQRFIEQTIAANAALNRLSENLNIGVSTISAWSNAAELSGGSAEGLQGTLDMLSKAQTQLKLTGESSLLPYFTALGVSLSDASGKARPINDILLSLADRFSKLDRTTANNMGRMLGIDQGTLNLLLKGRSEVELMIKRQREFNVVTKQQAEEATRLQRAITEGKQSFAAFGRELLSQATPALEKIFALFEDFGNWARENKEFVQDFLKIMAIGLGAIAAATIPINLTAVAVVGLAAAIAALWQDYQTWKSGGDSFIDWGKWEPGFKAAGEAIKWLRDLMGDLIYRSIAAADAISSLIKGDWKGAKFAGKEFLNGRSTTGSQSPGLVDDLGKVKTENNNRQKQAVDYFRLQGWTSEQAAGIVANLKRESSLNPNATGDNGKAFGLAQWHADRQSTFKKQFGKNIQDASFEDQLAFIQYELTQGNEKKAGDLLRNTGSAQAAAAAVSLNYERPADMAGEAFKRGQLAMQMLGGAPSASTFAQSNAPVNTAPTNNSLQTNIGEVKVYTAATDADGIAKDMGKSLDYLFASQANYGLF